MRFPFVRHQIRFRPHLPHPFLFGLRAYTNPHHYLFLFFPPLPLPFLLPHPLLLSFHFILPPLPLSRLIHTLFVPSLLPKHAVSLLNHQGARYFPSVHLFDSSLYRVVVHRLGQMLWGTGQIRVRLRWFLGQESLDTLILRIQGFG